MISLLDRIENIVGKGEDAGYLHFLLFPQCFQNASYTGSLKVVIVWKELNVDIFRLRTYISRRRHTTFSMGSFRYLYLPSIFDKYYFTD